MKPRTHCPASYVPNVTICDASELDPLVEFLATSGAVTEPRVFPRGTVLSDGRLDLCKQSIGPRGARRVLDALRNNTKITSILLGTDAIGGEGAAALGELVAAGESALETLYLGCNRIEGDAISGLTTPLADSKTIKALWLKRNPLGYLGATHIAALVAANNELGVLDLFNCELGDDGVAKIAAATTATLRALSIGGNGASCAAAEAIADLLSRSDALEDLSLGASPLGDDGAELLAAGLRENRGLVRLNVASCDIGERGARALFGALADHPTIEVVDAGRLLAARALEEPDNRIGDDTPSHVAQTLGDTPRLRSLDLRNAKIASNGALPLVPLLDDRHDVAFLGLSRFVSRRIRRRIAALLERNREEGAIVPPAPPYVAAIASVYRNPPTR